MATPWAVPPMWVGQTVVVMATGPSFTLAQAAAARRCGLPAIAVSDNGIDAEHGGDFASMLYSSDASWWRKHAQAALKFPGLKVTCGDSLEFKAVESLKLSGTEGFDPDPTCVRSGGNSGYAAVHVAIQAGARRVLLLGFDMGGSHWFGPHTGGLRNTDKGTFERWIARFPALAGRGAEIINCTPGSALKCFPSVPLDEALAHEHHCCNTTAV